MASALSAAANQIAQEGVWNSFMKHVYNSSVVVIKRTFNSVCTPTPLPDCLNSELPLMLLTAVKICNFFFGYKTTQKENWAYLLSGIPLAASVVADSRKDRRYFYAVMVVGLLALTSCEKKKKSEQTNNNFLGVFFLASTVINVTAGIIFLLRGQLTTVGVISLTMYTSILFVEQKKIERPNG